MCACACVLLGLILSSAGLLVPVCRLKSAQLWGVVVNTWCMVLMECVLCASVCVCACCVVNARCAGHIKCVEFLLSLPEVNINTLDQWKHTALDNAKQFGHANVAELLASNGGMDGSHVLHEANESPTPPANA